jgi:hypothetical protein
MPIKLPNLDDRTFADLVAEAHTLIPLHAPEWTNHNESDPGVTLIELFAYLTEIQIYRLNRVTDANLCAFLKLIDGVAREPSSQSRGMVTRTSDQKEVALRDEVRDVVLKLRQQDRAVTCDDFERLARAADSAVARAYCIPGCDLTSNNRYAVADAHMSLVIVPAEVKVFWFDGKAFVDLAGLNSGVNTPIPLWPQGTTTDARLYIGADTIFESISFQLQDTAKGYVVTFEYFNGKDWVKLTEKDHKLADQTANLTAGGAISFVPPPDWQRVEVNNLGRYWLRISSGTVPEKSPTVIRIFRDDLIRRVGEYIEPRRLLTTRVHVVGPGFVSIGVRVSLALNPDAVPERVQPEAIKQLAEFLNPQSWPFGRDVYVSEIYRLLDQIAGVDFVTTMPQQEVLTALGVPNREVRQDGELVAIRLNPDELARFSPEPENTQIVTMSAQKKIEA